MQRRPYFLTAIILSVVFAAVVTSTALVSAQSATGPFNPQTQLQAGSRIIFHSIYGIATARPHYQSGSDQPPHWNSSAPDMPTYNASITIDAQLSGDGSNNSVQFTVQGGVMVIGTSTIAITSGSGEINGVDKVLMQGTASTTDGEQINWRMNGLAALFNGAMISELTGNVSIILNGVETNLMVTYIATVN